VKESDSLQEEVKTPVRLVWVDFIRVVSTFLVVLAHAIGWGGDPRWMQTLYYTISRNGVPLFFMISGYLVLSREEGTWTFLKKRAWKILIPFFVWSTIYDVYWNDAFAETGLTFQAVFRLFIRILRGPRAEHLWFFYALIGLYLFAPVLRLFVKKARDLDVLYYIALWFLAVPILFVLEGTTPLRSGFELNYMTGYVGYYLLGLYLGRLNVIRRAPVLSLIVLLAGFVFSFLVFYLDLPPQGNETAFRSYLSLNIVLMAIMTFSFLRTAGESLPGSAASFLRLVGQSSFGIYLMHSIILQWMTTVAQSMGIKINSGPPILVVPFIALIAFSLSFLITHTLRRIPVLKTIVP
jgi:surface polysaccharide O-acyltransferase-like enzyme